MPGARWLSQQEKMSLDFCSGETTVVGFPKNIFRLSAPTPATRDRNSPQNRLDSHKCPLLQCFPMSHRSFYLSLSLSSLLSFSHLLPYLSYLELSKVLYDSLSMGSQSCKKVGSSIHCLIRKADSYFGVEILRHDSSRLNFAENVKY